MEERIRRLSTLLASVQAEEVIDLMLPGVLLAIDAQGNVQIVREYVYLLCVITNNAGGWEYYSINEICIFLLQERCQAIKKINEAETPNEA